VIARGPREGVDRLVFVADDGEVVAAPQPGIEERGLERIGVLVLVDREPAIAIAYLLGDRRIGLEQLDRSREHVLEVDQPGPVLGRLVASVQAGHEFDRQGAIAMGSCDAGTVAGGIQAAGLGPLDLGSEVANREVAIAARQRCRERSQQASLSLEDRRRLAAMDSRPEMAELAKGGGVERGGGDGAVAGGD
jgi:hypothetical protein